MGLYLQNRWKLEGRKLVYYGMRKKPYLLKNEYKLTKLQTLIINQINNREYIDDLKPIRGLINKEIVVTKSDLRTTPGSLNDAKYCKNCIANDFLIPGIEFDDNGLCPMCASKEETKDLKSVVPIINEIPKAKRSRFDVAVFYTGGKDSSFLLYYLAKVKKLRVLALTWDIPYMSITAKQSIENAKKLLDNVEFVSRTIANDDLRIAYQELYRLNENTCACPSLAYVLFYPLLVNEKVPYFILGNEPVQMKNLYYNGMAPLFTFKFLKNKFLQTLINISRIITLRPPYKKGQFHTIMSMKQLAYGDSLVKKMSGYENEMVSNIIASIHKIKHITKPLKKAIRSSSFTGNIPAFVHIDFDEISENKVYDWRDIKDKLVQEIGWVCPDEEDKGLHTSCSIEKCKEYSQFKRFYYMKSKMIPFSSIEISLASRDKNITKEQAINEIKTCLGLSLDEPKECELMKSYLNNKSIG